MTRKRIYHTREEFMAGKRSVQKVYYYKNHEQLLERKRKAYHANAEYYARKYRERISLKKIIGMIDEVGRNHSGHSFEVVNEIKQKIREYAPNY